ncbi:phenylalanine--tRNA ligase subunit beta [Candidatus Saccharibacteria bacterium]|nr:phenylalanine--tRNA ligase subunit beta [Candidatus Saccharibacteria bacterium]
MLVSLNWLKEYVDIKVSNETLIELIASRLVEVEQVIDQTKKYNHIYVVEVKSAEKIPDTHLTLCKIDDGGRADAKKLVRDADGLIQVMCGAPNVRKGMLAVWLAPGATVPASVNEDAPFLIGVRKMLKTFDSYGMLAGADELDLGDDHSGIVELDPASASAGDSFAELFSLNDIILDIENKSLTHRPDTFGIIGFAREVAGILGQPFVTPNWLTSDDTKDFPHDSTLDLAIEITDAAICPRYTALVLRVDDTAKKSKYLTKTATLLARSGVRPLDPIVDLTNYLMLLTGQPLHAFDYDKFLAFGKAKTPKIIVRTGRAGETITLLDRQTLKLTEDDIVITSNDRPVALAGAMGGLDTAIDANTKRILLESATFSLYNLRKTQMHHGIFSEAITRFTKGQPVAQTLPVALQYAALAGFATPLHLADQYPSPRPESTIAVDLPTINGLLGTSFQQNEAQTLLANVNIPSRTSADTLIFTLPPWRTDLSLPVDIVEELGRLSGYDNIPKTLPLHATATPNSLISLKTALRHHLAARGANEVLTYSFVHEDLLRKAGQNPDASYRLVNSISPDLQFVRQALLPSLLDKVYGNLRAGYHRYALFEFNQVYSKNRPLDADGVPTATHQLAFLYVSDDGQETYYYDAKLYLESVLAFCNISYQLRPITDDTAAPYFVKSRTVAIYDTTTNQPLGYLGEISPSILKSFKLPRGLSGFELDLTALLDASRSTPSQSFRTSTYPSVSRDLTLPLKNTTYASLYEKIRAVLDKHGLISKITPVSIYRQTDTLDAPPTVSFHLDFAHPDKTLTKSDSQTIMNQLEKIK